MKKAERQRWIELTASQPDLELDWDGYEFVNRSLCILCRYAGTDDREARCDHPIEAVNVSFPSLPCPGQDCWGFHPIVSWDEAPARLTEQIEWWTERLAEHADEEELMVTGIDAYRRRGCEKERCGMRWISLWLLLWVPGALMGLATVWALRTLGWWQP